MGLFMQKHRNKIILFMVGGGGLVLLYSFRKLPFCRAEATASE